MKNSKRASATIYLCVILASILLLVGTLTNISFFIASRSYGDSILDLAGRSILSEYDEDLKKDYGLFFFQMNKEDLENQYAAYIEKSFQKEKGITELIKMEIEDVKIDVSTYSATNQEVLLGQIKELMKYKVFAGDSKVLDLVGLGKKKNFDLNKKDNEKLRKLRNSRIIKELPSRQLQGLDIGTISNLSLPEPKKMGVIAYEEICLNTYIVEYFNHKLKKSEKASFFARELEYIICGNLSDEFNENIIYFSLLTFRTVMNTLHIKSDNKKMAIVRAAALVLGEGIASPAIEASLIASWAGAEAALDLQSLNKGGKVALMKTEASWKLSLDSALGQDLLPLDDEESEEGLDYQDYLFLFLCFKSKESKLVRIMDLIHLNIKGGCNKEFSYNDCAGGFTYQVEFDRKRKFEGSHEY